MRPKEFITIIVMLLMSFAFPVKQINSQEIGWQKLNFVPTYPLYGVYCINYDTVVGVGANGYIIRTTDSGEHWDSIPSNTTNSLYRVHFVNQTTGYVVGEKGTILKTYDMGLTWENIGISTNLNLFSLSFINKDTGWVAGGEGDFYEPNGNKGILLKSKNGGASWFIDSTYDKTISSVFFIDNDTGYICENNYPVTLLKKTINSGNSFFIIDSSGAYYYDEIFFINPKIGYFFKNCTPGGGIYKTNDYGVTWSEVVTQWGIKSLKVIDSCSFYYSWSDMGGEGSMGINTCTSDSFIGPGYRIFDFSFINLDSGFAVGSNPSIHQGVIFRRGILSNIINEGKKQKIEIFPNPFKDKIIITLSSDIDISEINLMVYNSIGQKILYNPNLKNNQIIIDLADEPNGLYYLIIRDNNKIIRTEKLIKL